MSKLLVASCNTAITREEIDAYNPQLSEKEKIRWLKNSKKFCHNILNIFIDGKRLDKILADIVDKSYFGLVPSLIDWYDESSYLSKQEKEYVINKCSFEEGKYILPILLCPDDFDFTCVIVSVEVLVDKQKVIWNRIGLNTNKESIQVYDNNGNELLGKKINWFDSVQKYEFDLEDYKLEMNKFLSILKQEKVKPNIPRYLSLKELAKDLYFINNVSIDDEQIKILFHYNFEVTIKNGTYFETYINGVFYYSIEDQDILYSLKEFADGEVIIVQYEHKHGLLDRNRFRVYQKDKFTLERVKHFKDIKNI